MTKRDLEMFVTVVEEGTMSRASEKLYVSQPSISQSIAKFEERYKVRLFDRVNGRLKITETGERYYRYAKRILNTYERMEDDLLRANEGNTIHFGICRDLGISNAVGLVNHLEEEFPHLNLKLISNVTDVLLKKMREREIDIAIVEREELDDRVKAVDLLSSEMMMVCNPSHPLAQKSTIELQDLVGYDYIIQQRDSNIERYITNQLNNAGVNVNYKWESQSVNDILEIVRQTEAVCIVSEHHLYNATGVVAKRIQDAHFQRSFSVVYYKYRAETEDLKDFIDTTQEYFKRDK